MNADGKRRGGGAPHATQQKRAIDHPARLIAVAASQVLQCRSARSLWRTPRSDRSTVPLSRKGDFQIAPAVWKPPLLGIVFTGLG
jgi:hypothetical protein